MREVRRRDGRLEFARLGERKPQTSLPERLDAYRADPDGWAVAVIEGGYVFGAAFGKTKQDAFDDALELWNDNARRNDTARVSARRWASVPVKDCEGEIAL